VQSVTLVASYQGMTVQKTLEIRPVATTPTTVSYTASFPIGWTLAGNGLATPIDVAATFGATGIADKVTTVWAWDAITAKWNFYSPALSSTQLLDYAGSKGYGVLSSIDPRQGYWVNAAQPVDLPQRTAAPVTLTATDLIKGWNLVAQGVSSTPADFNQSLSDLPPVPDNLPASFISLWAWDNLKGAWYFYAPTLAAQGGTALKDYADAKGYLDFATQGKTLGLDTGFWINRQ